MSTSFIWSTWCRTTGRRFLTARATLSMVFVFAVGLWSWSVAQPGIYGAQLEYQQSRVEAYHLAQVSQGLIGSALPAGEYAWSIEFRCVTHEACVEAFGYPLLVPWQESFTFAAHLTSDGTRMHYTGANIYRGRPGAGELGDCDDPGNVPFSGTCVLGETAEVFVVQDPSLPATQLVGRPWLWIRNAHQYAPLETGGNRVVPCACGPDAVPTPTIAVPGLHSTEFFAAGREVPDGVEMTVLLVRMP